MRRPVRMAALLALAATLPAIVTAQSVPNLSGTWVLAPDKSDFGAMPAPPGRTDVITHEEPKLTIKRTVGGASSDLVYGIDGKPWKNTIPQGEITSTLAWDGQVLVMTSSLSIQGNDLTIVDRLSLSADGKTLTQARTLSVQGQEVVQTLVFAKQ